MNNSPETRATVNKGLKEDVQENSLQKTSIQTLNEKNKGYGELKSCKNELMVKICGITRANDLKCVESQASDYIGFINVKRSPRFCEMDKIKGLAGLLTNKNRAVLVLEPENPSEAFSKIKSSEIFNIQLHSLDLSELRDLKNKINSLISNNSEEGYFKINIIRAIGLSDIIDESKKREIQSFSEICDSLLFDYQMQGKSGGTGKQIPLDLAIKASEIARNTNSNIKIFLAGGMDLNRMKTEGKIISQFFDVVDFNSYLEDAPGIKNKEKIKNLMNLLKEFNCR